MRVWTCIVLAAALCGACDQRGPSTGTAATGGTPAGVAPSPTRDGASDLRVVALSPAIGTMLRDLGLEGRIVGRHAFDLALSSDVPVVGDQLGIDYEELIRADPTHVVLQWGTRDLPPRLVQLADERGWTLLDYDILALDDVPEVFDDLHLKLATDPSAWAARPGGLDGVIPERGPPGNLPSARLAHAWRDRGEAARAAGRVLVLASVDPPGVTGPGSFHFELVERLGATPVPRAGSAWIEVDAERVLEIQPDAILVLSRTSQPPTQPASFEDAVARLGPIARLPIRAIAARRVALIEGPHVLDPSSTLGEVANQIADVFERWAREAPEDDGSGG